MFDDSSPSLVPSSPTSSRNFDNLPTEDESDNSKDFFSVLKKSVAKHVYCDEEKTTDKNCLSKSRSTTRIDSSDLISRCKNFLPLLTDANRNLFSKIESGENVRIELDSDQEDDRIIEMNLMFCPNIDSAESEESDDDDDDDQTTDSTLFNFIKKKKPPVNIVEISPTDSNQCENNVVNK